MTHASPTVSIGIVARARIPELDRLIDDLLALPGAETREIVVAVETPGASEPLETPDERGVRWIALPAKRGIAYNRNRVLEAVRAEILVTIDDDCVPEPGWLDALLAALEDPAVTAVAGTVHVPPAGFVGDSISALGFPAGGSAGYETMFHVGEDGSTDNLTTCSAAMRVATVREVGGFDESLTFGGEDTELAHRLVTAGKRLVFAPGASVIHPARTQLGSFAGWFYRRGRAKMQFARKVPIRGYVQLRVHSYGRILSDHIADPKIVLIAPLLAASVLLQQIGFVAEWVSPAPPPKR